MSETVITESPPATLPPPRKSVAELLSEAAAKKAAIDEAFKVKERDLQAMKSDAYNVARAYLLDLFGPELFATIDEKAIAECASEIGRQQMVAVTPFGTAKFGVLFGLSHDGVPGTQAWYLIGKRGAFLLNATNYGVARDLNCLTRDHGTVTDDLGEAIYLCRKAEDSYRSALQRIHDRNAAELERLADFDREHHRTQGATT